MDTYTFFETIFTGLSTDTALGTWAQAAFQKPVKVFADIDTDAYPDDDSDLPYIILDSPGKHHAQDERIAEYLIYASLVLDKSTYEVRAEENVVELKGVKLISDFIKLTKAAMTAALPDNFVPAYTTETDTVGQVPFVYGELLATFKETFTIGQNPLD